MAAPPVFKGFALDAIPAETRAELEPFFRQLNPLLLGLTGALTGALTFGENFAGVVFELKVKPPTDWLTVGESAVALGSLSGNAWFRPDSTRLPKVRRVGDEVQFSGTIRSPSAGAVDVTNPAIILPNDARWLPENGGGFYSATTTSPPPTSVTWGVAERSVYIAAGGSTGTTYALDGIHYVVRDRRPVPASVYPLLQRWTLPGRCAALVPLRAYALDASGRSPDAAALPPGPVDVAWSETTRGADRFIRIDNITGLIPGKDWRVVCVGLSG